jgi:hypothetical protein
MLNRTAIVFENRRDVLEERKRNRVSTWTWLEGGIVIEIKEIIFKLGPGFHDACYNFE